ncbi:vascular endothelial growth factor D isoform X2 [Cherax quadricarinatus]|uniref:vascular endothelial growth factor D isoform X2 n=1 Tax=Cherax quadricarinatus TaxID=27406 RepID=UPI002379AC49|nr:vascular endothelial growth factor D-like isoform X2 [Cherax quadricarinatus]
MWRTGDITGWCRIVVVMVALEATQVLAVPKLYDTDLFTNSRQYSSNDVYPSEHVDSSLHQPKFSKALAVNMSQVTDLTMYIMEFVRDRKICLSQTFSNLFLSNETSNKAKNWWRRRCGRRAITKNQLTPKSESTLIRYRRKSSNRSNSKPKKTLDLTDSEMKKLQALLKDKKVQCNPKKVVVELPNQEPHLLTLKPSCVYIKQCGGCCDSSHLECRPTVTKNKRFKVLVIKKRDLSLPGPQPFKTVVVAEHKKCQCECKVRMEHCTGNQLYDSDACSCYCPQESHKNCSSGKVWDDQQCDCVCSGVSECTTGRYFDTNSCRCLRP